MTDVVGHVREITPEGLVIENRRGEFVSVAFADLVVVKVLDQEGSGPQTTRSEGM